MEGSYFAQPAHQMVILPGEGRPKLSQSLTDTSLEEFQGQYPIGAGLDRFELGGEKIVRTNVAALSANYQGGALIGALGLSVDVLALRDSHSADGPKREWTMRRVE